MLRDLLGGSVGFMFSSENDGDGPEISMTDDLAEMRLGKQPGGCDPAFNHVGITPASHVVCSLLDTALRTLNDVCGAKAFVQRGRKLQPLDRKHFSHTFAQAFR